MKSYFITRIILFLTLICSLYSLAMLAVPEYYAKEYEDVKIVKQEKKKNASCGCKQIFVEFDCVGTYDGKKYHFKDWFSSEREYGYTNLKENKIYNKGTWYGNTTWITTVVLLILSFIVGFYQSEKLYLRCERVEVNEGLYEIWKFFFKFLGYDKEMTNKVIEEMDKFVKNFNDSVGNRYSSMSDDIIGFDRLRQESKRIMQSIKG